MKLLKLAGFYLYCDFLLFYSQLPEDSDEEEDISDIDDATPGTSTVQLPRRKRNREDLNAPDDLQDAHNERIRQQTTQIQVRLIIFCLINLKVQSYYQHLLSTT